MSWDVVDRLLKRLNRVFAKDPDDFLALRLQYDGGLSWSIDEGVLTTSVAGGTGSNLALDLSTFSVLGLANYLDALPGYSVPYVDGSALGALSALVLYNQGDNIAGTNGDHLYGFQSLLWAYFKPAGEELWLAEQAIDAMPAEITVTTSDGRWTDLHGDYFKVPRLSSEPDGPYGQRIISETLLPKGNNVAIEAVIVATTGQECQVVDVFEGTFLYADGSVAADGSHLANGSGSPRYCLFDVNVDFDGTGALDAASFTSLVTAQVNRLRDAGTYLRAVNLTATPIQDTVPLPSEAGDSMTVFTAQFANGSHKADGSLYATGSSSVAGSMALAGS